MASLTVHIPTTNNHTIQASSQQDFATSGTSQNGEFQYLVICDTHGKLPFSSTYDFQLKELFESLDWKTILQEENFFELIQTKIKNIDTHRLGSTLSICKIYPDRFENYWAGDSSIKIYSEGVEVWKTKDHDYNNEEDITRIQELSTFLRMKDAFDSVAETKTTIKQVKSKCFYFKNKEEIKTRLNDSMQLSFFQLNDPVLEQIHEELKNVDINDDKYIGSFIIAFTKFLKAKNYKFDKKNH